MVEVTEEPVSLRVCSTGLVASRRVSHKPSSLRQTVGADVYHPHRDRLCAASR